MRSSVMWLLPLALVSAAWPACKPGSAAKMNGARGVTVLYQSNANGEIEPCG
jgi:hypothetical protein